MRVTVVAAVGSNSGIGLAGRLLWRLPEDLQHFKELTSGHPIIMGRTTWDSIGRPLPNRTNIVLTRQSDWAAEGAVVAHDLDDALLRASALDDDVFIIGGGQIYEEVFERELADRLILTLVDDAPEADTFFPEVHPLDWREIDSAEFAGPPPFVISDFERLS